MSDVVLHVLVVYDYDIEIDEAILPFKFGHDEVQRSLNL